MSSSFGGGNFIASLLDLENKIKSMNNRNKMVYVFYENTSACSWAKRMIQEGKNIYFIKKKKLIGFKILKNILEDNYVNILHLHYTIPIKMLVLIKLFMPNIRIVVHWHMFAPSSPNSFRRKTKKTVLCCLYNIIIDMICGVSEDVYNGLIKWGIQEKKCCYIDNGIVFSRLDTRHEDKKQVYYTQNKVVIMIYGTNFYIKGVDVAINALKNIATKNNIILMIVCEDNELVLKQIKKILSYIPDWIITVPCQENIAFYYRMSNLYLAVSRKEGFMCTILESIYLGTPVIRSDNPSMNRNIPNEIVIPADDAFALQQAILSFLNDKNDKSAILERQKNYIISKWNIDIWSKNISDMYLELIENNL